MATSVLNLISQFSPVKLTGLHAKDTTVKANASAASSATPAASSSTNGGLTGTTTGTTFLNLLVKELQNQDPTAPMDSTAMVGQMISLNQLDQLISINQVLSGLSNPVASSRAGSSIQSAAVAGGSNSSSAAQLAQRMALLTSGQQANAMQAASQAAFNPAQTLDFSALNIPFGGK